MYASQFGLKQAPFSIAPDPRFLFMSERHREALAHLLYGVGSGGGFVLLSGAIGAGKTTVCRCFLGQLPVDCDVAYIFNPKLSVPELLSTVCQEFGIEAPAGGTVKEHVDPLNSFLLKSHAAGRHSLLVIDEAQNLSPEVLEQLRLLTNLETDTHKLLQIVLIGQPELRDKLARPGMEQLAQRVIARYHLDALSADETPQYVRHRLGVAGLSGPMPFDTAALARVHRHTGGVPRRINLLCDRALLGAYAQGRGQVSAAMVDQAAREVFDGSAGAKPPLRARAPLALALAGAGVLLAGAGWWWGARDASPALPAAMALPSVAATAATAAAADPPAPPAAPPSSPAPPLRDAAELAALTSGLWADEGAAWQALASSWQAEVPAADPCRALTGQGLACYQNSATLAQIRQLDRPGWLTLQAQGGAPGRVLLTGLADQEALLQGPDGPMRVTLATLATLWRGDFATLWRTPPGYGGSGPVRAGGPLADWLLAQLGGYQAGALPLNAPLAVRIEAFQRAQGLAPDGVAGPLTLMQLNRAVAVPEPRLATGG